MSFAIPTPDRRPSGPFFIDTESCQCALQPANQTAVESGSALQGWRCIGDPNSDVYTGESGKWFLPIDQNDDYSNDINGGPPPNLQTTYIINNATHELEPLKEDLEDQLSILDQVCSGQRDTEQTSIFYDQLQQVEDGNVPVPPPICLAGTQPVQLQNASTFAEKGCNLGFFCKSDCFRHPKEEDQRLLISYRPEQYCDPTSAMVSTSLRLQQCSARWSVLPDTHGPS